MITIFSPEHELHNPPREYTNGVLSFPYEIPERAAILRQAMENASLGPILPARDFGLDPVRQVHTIAYLDFLKNAYQRWVKAGGNPQAVVPDTLAVRGMQRYNNHPLAEPGYYFFDVSAPIVPGTYKAALAAVNVALTGADLLLQNKQSPGKRQPAVYSLCRPPGHHAGSDLAGGYCYLNNAAIAAEYLIQQDRRDKRIAILDIDLHHGNGTQQIFYSRSDVLFVSIHIDPAVGYPYFMGFADEQGSEGGESYNVNIPLAEGTTQTAYLAALDLALTHISSYSPQYLIVSTGFDTYAHDPIGAFGLSISSYLEIGRRIAALSLPTLFIQEGGYALDVLGTLAVGLFQGFEA